MPELPDLTIYVEALEARILGQPLLRVRIPRPFLLRSVEPSPSELEGRAVTGVTRLGKRIVIAFEGELYAVVHLMIAGRFKWKTAGAPPRSALASFEFPPGTLVLTEAGSKKRASLHLVAGSEALRRHHRGGLEPLDTDAVRFRDRLLSENHTLKRALTDPRLFSGIGNAYSDEILWEAGLSPLRLTSQLSRGEVDRLFHATVNCLSGWIERLREQTGSSFPSRVTAFRPEMAVHGKFGQQCPRCGHSVQRIRYAENELNYCASCQTGGKILRDRALSRILRDDWPGSLEGLEQVESSPESGKKKDPPSS